MIKLYNYCINGRKGHKSILFIISGGIMNNTEKLFILGNNLIEAKARYYRALYSFENAISITDISIRKEHKLCSTVRMTETEIRSEAMDYTQNERNELKLSQIALAKAEISYEMEKLRLQCEVKS